jgi:hypothetical protein
MSVWQYQTKDTLSMKKVIVCGVNGRCVKLSERVAAALVEELCDVPILLVCNVPLHEHMVEG